MEREGDIVTWRPGRVGKGWVQPDGTVKAWSVNHRELPAHAEVEHLPGSVRFRISPEAEVEMLAGGAWHADAARAAVATAIARLGTE